MVICEGECELNFMMEERDVRATSIQFNLYCSFSCFFIYCCCCKRNKSYGVNEDILAKQMLSSDSSSTDFYPFYTEQANDKWKSFKNS